MAITALPKAVTLPQAPDGMAMWLGASRACRAAPWFLYFRLSSFRWPLERTTTGKRRLTWTPALAMLCGVA